MYSYFLFMHSYYRAFCVVTAVLYCSFGNTVQESNFKGWRFPLRWVLGSPGSSSALQWPQANKEPTAAVRGTGSLLLTGWEAKEWENNQPLQTNPAMRMKSASSQRPSSSSNIVPYIFPKHRVSAIFLGNECRSVNDHAHWLHIYCC